MSWKSYSQQNELPRLMSLPAPCSLVRSSGWEWWLSSPKGVSKPQSAAGEELRPFSGRTLMPSILDKAFMEEPGVCRSAMIRDVKCQFEPLRVQRMRSFKGFLGVLRGKKTDTA